MHQIKVFEPTGRETRIIVAWESSKDMIEGRLLAEGMDFDSTEVVEDDRDKSEKDQAYGLVGMLLD